MVEHPAVNRRVGGSSPLRGANFEYKAVLSALLFYFLIEHCVKYWYNNYAQHVHYI